MRIDNLIETLKNTASMFPDEMIEDQIRDIPRISFNIGISLDALRPQAHTELEICDLGGGIGLLSAGCAAYGLKRTVLVDDFDDPVNHRLGNSVLDLHKKLGVEVFSRDVVRDGIRDISGAFDIITSFDSMEHWHNSPKRLFKDVVEKLKPGGVFVLGVPNCVNLRKRISVPFGFGKWSSMDEWYEKDKFRGHVREPDVNDLLYISRDMHLSQVKIYGRNWLGAQSANRVIRILTKIVDRPIRLLPSLCSDIYLVGKKL